MENESDSYILSIARDHFDSTQIPLWEQDFSRIFQYLSDFHASEDLEHLFRNYPEEAFVCSNRIITLRVNPAMLHAFHAHSMEEFNAEMAWNFVEETIDAFGKLLGHLLTHNTSFKIESYIGSVDRRKQRGLLRWIVPEAGVNRLNRILFTLKLL
jgi:hypothetical protein